LPKNSGIYTSRKAAMDSIEVKWVGFKGIMWNTVQNGKTVVKWLDKNEDVQILTSGV
jgi:hypothetical protein